jgi:hypothetical protein
MAVDVPSLALQLVHESWRISDRSTQVGSKYGKDLGRRRLLNATLLCLQSRCEEPDDRQQAKRRDAQSDNYFDE